MQPFNHRPLAPPRLTEKSPLFNVMVANTYQAKYMEISGDEEDNSQNVVTKGSSDAKINAPYSTILFIAILVLVFIMFAVTSLYQSPSVSPPNNWRTDESPITAEVTKMTLIRTETVGNAKSVRVVTSGSSGEGPEVVLAEGVYITNVKNNGWNHLRAHMPNIPLTDDYDYFSRYFMQWEAMGFLEGYVTCQELQLYYVNLYHGLFDGGDIVPEAVDFLVENHDWVRAQAEANWRTSDYWLSVKALLVQLTGLLNGLREGCPSSAGGDANFDVYSSESLRTLYNKPTLVNMLLLNANGDLYQIAAKYNQMNQPPAAGTDDTAKYTNPPPPTVNGSTFFDDDNHVKVAAEMFLPKRYGRARGGREKLSAQSTDSSQDRYLRSNKFDAKGNLIEKLHTEGHYGSDHCSALIRLLPDNSDVLFTHNTWDDFQNAAPRIFKEYSFPQPTYRKPQGVNDNPNDQTTPTTAPVVSSSSSSSSDVNGENVVKTEAFANANNKNSEKGSKSTSTSGTDTAGSTPPVPSPAGTSAPTSIPNTKTYSIAASQMVDIHFSSSPGFLTSVDDFYTISGSGNMAVIETSLDIYDQTLLTQVHYDAVLSWMRFAII